MTSAVPPVTDPVRAAAEQISTNFAAQLRGRTACQVMLLEPETWLGAPFHLSAAEADTFLSSLSPPDTSLRPGELEPALKTVIEGIVWAEDEKRRFEQQLMTSNICTVVQAASTLRSTLTAQPFGLSEFQAREFGATVRVAASTAAAGAPTGSTFAKFVEHKAFKEACDWIASNASRYAANPKTDPPACVPMKVEVTWNYEETGHELREKSDALCRLPHEYRCPQLMGLRLGTGFGKTHVLMDAPEHLDCPVSTYITYNGEQMLDGDREYPLAALLMRILLRLFKTPNVNCPQFFLDFPAVLKVDSDRLVDLVAFAVQNRLAGSAKQRFFVGIDEIQLLCREVSTTAPERVTAKADKATVAGIASTLGEVVVALNEKEITATVLISALTFHTFKIIGDRPLLQVQLKPSDSESHEFVRRQLLPTATAQQKVWLEASCGVHFRSVVVACDWIMNSNALPSVPSLLRVIGSRLRMRMDDEQKHAVRQYVCSAVGGPVAPNSLVVPLLGADGGVPPAIVWLAFENVTETRLHPARRIFVVSASKMPMNGLELCGLQYDRFRMCQRLPVIPFGVNVTNTEDPHFYSRLCFNITHVSNSSLFRSSRGGGVKRTSVRLRPGLYYHPNVDHHPWIDRATVAFDPSTRTQCLLLYRDKINEDWSETVRDLNRAAKIMRDEHPTLAILCIAHVVGASSATHVQQLLEFPYLLIRRPDLAAFYTPTFAPAITFLMDRHRTTGSENDGAPEDAWAAEDEGTMEDDHDDTWAAEDDSATESGNDSSAARGGGTTEEGTAAEGDDCYNGKNTKNGHTEGPTGDMPVRQKRRRSPERSQMKKPPQR